MDLECKKCGYEWQYAGKLLFATCPNCYNKVLTNLGKKIIFKRGKKKSNTPNIGQK